MLLPFLKIRQAGEKGDLSRANRKREAVLNPLAVTCIPAGLATASLQIIAWRSSYAPLFSLQLVSSSSHSRGAPGGPLRGSAAAVARNPAARGRRGSPRGGSFGPAGVNEGARSDVSNDWPMAKA
jgi:hypothetical protein